MTQSSPGHLAPRPSMTSHCLWTSMNTSPTSWACFPFWPSCLGFPHTPGAEAHLVYLLFSNRIPSFPTFMQILPFALPLPHKTPFQMSPPPWSLFQSPQQCRLLFLWCSHLLWHLFSTWSQEHSLIGGSWVRDTCTNASLHSRVWAGGSAQSTRLNNVKLEALRQKMQLWLFNMLSLSIPSIPSFQQVSEHLLYAR